MNGGSVSARRSPIAPTAAVVMALVLLGLQAGSARAQTPSEVCAADTLYLISPEMIDLKLETTGRRGLTITWPNLDLNDATCFSLKDTEDLGFDVIAEGGFGDTVDRVFNFSSPDSGGIGSDQTENIIVTWRNQGPATYGNIGGLINLANNGGIMRYTPGAGWTQSNTGLPMFWFKANAVGLAKGAGEFMVAGFSRGVTPESDPVGLFTYDGVTWSQIATDVFNAENMITGISISPQSNDSFAVGTARNGLYITNDGGQNFTQWTLEFDPSYDPLPPNFTVDVVEWSGTRIFTFLRNFGLFISSDGGASFVRSELKVPSDLDSSTPSFEDAVINALSFHPTDPDRVAASLNFHGAYESRDGGTTWQDLYGDLVVAVEGQNGAWVNTGLDLVYDQAMAETMVMAVYQKGLYRTVDGGLTWVLVGDGVQPDNRGDILAVDLVSTPDTPGTLLALEDSHSLLASTDSGATWAPLDPQPLLNQGYFLTADADGTGGITMGSWGGGLYVPGTALNLSDTFSTITSPELRNLELGLAISFGAGVLNPLDTFDLICQTFQGWAVWRGTSNVPGDMTLIGLFDRVNPEDCFEGYCGDLNIEIIPNCFAAKRAACYNCVYPDGTTLPCGQEYPENWPWSTTDIDTVRFFDEEIYNGFTYNYAVTSFDYGNTARVTPENNSNAMLFSPRFEGDFIENGGVSPFPGAGNITPIQINQPLEIGEEGYEEIYVFPNPLRADFGIPGSEGEAVTFKNIPEGSKILIFTVAGDKVIDLKPESILGGNLHWDAKNDSGEAISSGVYLFKVEMVERESIWGRLVVIR